MDKPQRVIVGIRSLTPEQADQLRARLHRDFVWYQKLCRRLAAWWMRDEATQRMIELASRVEHDLWSLHLQSRFAGDADGKVDRPEDWTGWGI